MTATAISPNIRKFELKLNEDDVLALLAQQNIVASSAHLLAQSNEFAYFQVEVNGDSRIVRISFSEKSCEVLNWQVFHPVWSANIS